MYKSVCNWYRIILMVCVCFFPLTVYQVWFSNRRARLRKQMSSNTGSSTPGSGGYGMGLALGYSPSAQQQNQQSSGPNSSSTPAYIMSPQQLHEPYNTSDGYKGMQRIRLKLILFYSIFNNIGPSLFE